MSDVKKGVGSEVRPYCYNSVDMPAKPRKKDEFVDRNKRWNNEADIYKEKAMEEAARILDIANEEACLIKKEALEQGRSEGYEDGYQQGCKKAREEYDIRLQQELQSMQDELEKAIEEISIQKDKCMEQYIDSLKNVVLSIGEKIIRTSLQSSGEVIKRMIIAATDKMKRTEWAKIYITKYDYDFMVKADSTMVGELTYLSDNIKLVVMEQGDPGTCIIELPNEIIDASVSTQLENIKDILNNARL